MSAASPRLAGTTHALAVQGKNLSIVMAVDKTKYNLTDGSIFKKILLVAVPIMGTQLVQMAFNLTDMFWLGRVGSDAVAAAGAAGLYIWLSFGLVLIGRMGAEIGVAQSLGRGDKKTALSLSQNALFIALVLGTFAALMLIFFNHTLISFYNFREIEIARNAADYLFYVGLSMPLFFVYSAINGIFYASGDSRTPFIINCIGLLVNVVLDPIFIFTFNMGVKGSAIATAFSQLTVGICLIWALLFYKNRPFEKYLSMFRIEWSKIFTMLKWSIPIGIESLLFSFLAMVTTRIETTFGAAAVATARVGTQIEALSWLIGGGFGSALVAFMGQNFGAGKTDRIKRGVKISFLTMGIWGSLVTIYMLTLGQKVFAFFLPDPSIFDLGRIYLFILAFCQIPGNLEAVASGSFRGQGRTIPPSVASITSNAIRPVLALLLSRTSLGVYGVWWAVSITAILRGVWICIWYLIYQGKKRTSNEH